MSTDRRAGDDGSLLVVAAPGVRTVAYGGATVSYRQELPVRTRGDRVEVVWSPETRVCRLAPDCGYEGTYLPGRGDYLDGVVVESSANTSG